MSTLWAIEVTPLNGRGEPWLDRHTVSSTRRDAWAKYLEDLEPDWWRQEVKRRQRNGLLRAVKVTIQIKE